MLEDISARTICAAIAILTILTSLSGSAFAYVNGSAISASEDVFGITKIYPTKEGGREWSINMDKPADGVFDPRTSIEKEPDGSWRVSGHDNGKYQVRMNVYTPKDEEEWKNVEITGYAKVVRTVGHE